YSPPCITAAVMQGGNRARVPNYSQLLKPATTYLIEVIAEIRYGISNPDTRISFMSLIAPLLLLALWTGQADERPAYAREGERVEQEFLAYKERLVAFFITLRGLVDQQPASATLPRLQTQDAPPPAVIRYGYGVLPQIIDTPSPGPAPVYR